MENNFESIIDTCIDRINHGESIEACLKDYPEHAAELKSLLLAVVHTRSAYSITPSPDRKRLARQRFYAALEKQKKFSLAGWLRRAPVWGTVAAVLAILLIGFFALRATVLPVSPPVMTIASANANGNFAFLVSDDENAIGDFSGLFVTIEKVSLLQEGDNAQLVEFVPDTKQFDLSLLPGDKTLELWRGDVPAGNYSQVVIQVSSVYGNLKATGEQINIKLPSSKLQLNKGFSVITDSITSFTYDLTVIKTGKVNNSKYILKPQIDASGAAQEAINTSATDNGKKNARPDK